MSTDDGTHREGDHDSAARNPEHADDHLDRKIDAKPGIQPSAVVVKIVVVLVLLVIGFIAFKVSAAYFPRWWAQRVANQVEGDLSRGTTWGLFYGFVFTAVPLLLLAQVRRRFLSWAWRGIVVVVALLLAMPNWLTLAIVTANSKAAHAGERILDVDGPGFRAGSLIGAVAGAGVALLITLAGMQLAHRKKQVRDLKGRLSEQEKVRRDAEADGDGESR